MTTEGGLDVRAAERSLAETRMRMNDAGIEVSLFIAPDEEQVASSARTGCQFVELHTGAFAGEFQKGHGESSVQPNHELHRLVSGARLAHSLGLKVNAGHGLNYENLPTLLQVPYLVELNIGHSIVSRALFTGIENAVRQMFALMADYPPGP